MYDHSVNKMFTNSLLQLKWLFSQITKLISLPVDPVENVKSSVRSQGKEIVTGDGLCFSSLRHHEQLGQDGHRFKIDRESPQNFHY